MFLSPSEKENDSLVFKHVMAFYLQGFSDRLFLVKHLSKSYLYNLAFKCFKC